MPHAGHVWTAVCSWAESVYTLECVYVPGMHMLEGICACVLKTHICVRVCKYVCLWLRDVLAGLCCVSVAYVFTPASICIFDGIYAHLGGHL